MTAISVTSINRHHVAETTYHFTEAWARFEMDCRRLCGHSALQILAILRCGDRREMESRTHDLLRDSRIHGEWFHVEPVLAFIERHSSVRPAVLP